MSPLIKNYAERNSGFLSCGGTQLCIVVLTQTGMKCCYFIFVLPGCNNQIYVNADTKNISLMKVF